MKIDVPLTGPQEQFVFSDAKAPAIVGGLGCVHPDTKIWTELGLMRISEITFPIRVLSWNEKDQRFQLSLSGGSFPKGRANLHRVRSRSGEFLATEHHRFFSSEHKFAQVGDRILSATKASQSLLKTIAERGPKEFPSGDEHYLKINEDLMGRCADEARQYGQRFLSAEGSETACLPSRVGAHKLSHSYDCFEIAHKDDQAALLQAHTHHDQFACRSQMTGCDNHSEELASTLEDHISALHAEHILQCRQQLQRSHVKTKPRCKLRGSCLPDLSRNLSLACETSFIEYEDILEVSEVERNHVYYDMQVLNTNNYVDEFGFIHHNSGKSQAGITRLILLMLSDKGANGAYYMPTYDLLKLRAMPGVEDFLLRLNLPFSVNKSDYMISIKGYGDIIFRSYDKPERIIAYETAHSIVDELDTIAKDKAALVWRKITERNRQKRKGKNTIGLVTTPDQGYNGFVFQKWVKENNDGYVIIKASTYSNPYLPDDYIEQIISNYDPILADLYLNGEFVSLSDKKVYHFFDRKKHHSDRVIKSGDRLFIGLDFNIGGCCATTFVIDGNVPIAVDEFVSHDTYDFVNNLARYKGHKLCVYPDASGKSGRTNASASDIDIIRHAGYECDPPNENPFVRDRINSVNALLSHETLLVNTDKCPELTFALESQGYDKNGDPEKFKDHPAIDDWVDCAGYFIHRKYPVRKPISDVKIKFSW